MRFAISGWNKERAVARWEEDECIYLAFSEGMDERRERWRADIERISCMRNWCVNASWTTVTLNSSMQAAKST